MFRPGLATVFWCDLLGGRSVLLWPTQLILIALSSYIDILSLDSLEGLWIQVYLCVSESLQVLFVHHVFLVGDYVICCSAFCEAGHYYSLCWQQYEMCGPAMAAAIAAADNVTNVRCPGPPVAGVTGYGLATGSPRVTYVRSSCSLHFIVKLRSPGKPSGIQAAGRSCCHIIPNFGRKSASKNFSVKIC